MIRVEPHPMPKRAEPTNTRGLLKSFVKRIESIKEEQDALSKDVRDIYAEVKAAGFDKTALGQVIAIRRKREKDPEKFAELDATVQLYLTEIEGSDEQRPSRAHARAREEGIGSRDVVVRHASAAPTPAGRVSDESPGTSPKHQDAGPAPAFLIRKQVSA